MAKKDKTRESAPSANSTPLKHNPFAALVKTQVAPDSASEPQTRAPQAESAVTSEQAGRPSASAPNRAQGQAQAPAPARDEGARPKTRGRLVLRRETKHRGGKAVIVISGFAQLRDFGEAATEALAKQLKQQLGCGGTVEGEGAKREIILQGDRAAKVAELLRAQGFRVDGVTS